MFWMPSRPAISIAANGSYGVDPASGKRTSTRLPLGLGANGIRHAAVGAAEARKHLYPVMFL